MIKIGIIAQSLLLSQVRLAGGCDAGILWK